MQITETPQFKAELEKLSKKYRHIAQDLKVFYKGFTQDPFHGAFAIPGGQNYLWKTRLKSSDMQRGKSGGFRIIFAVSSSPQSIYMLSIYAKVQKADISTEELTDLFKSYFDTLRGKE